MSYNYRNMLEYRNCNECSSRHTCFLLRIPLYHYPENVQNFVISVPQSALKYYPGQWHANYQEIQKQIVQYYDLNNCELLGNEVRILTNTAQRESDRQKIRELFKQYLDTAAKATEDKNPELSIMFDGIGLVLVSDYLEAVGKIFSMFKTMEKIKINTTNRCGWELP
ncbi:MAG: hypothetical protein J1E83_05760 [Lachnospiraceae bacterium]|nr:hypothetical protein [Lachnospiraceae bacterium]